MIDQLCSVCGKDFVTSEPPEILTIDLSTPEQKPETFVAVYQLKHIARRIQPRNKIE